VLTPADDMVLIGCSVSLPLKKVRIDQKSK